MPTEIQIASKASVEVVEMISEDSGANKYKMLVVADLDSRFDSCPFQFIGHALHLTVLPCTTMPRLKPKG
jgi:hypothetical protein